MFMKQEFDDLNETAYCLHEYEEKVLKATIIENNVLCTWMDCYLYKLVILNRDDKLYCFDKCYLLWNYMYVLPYFIWFSIVL